MPKRARKPEPTDESLTEPTAAAEPVAAAVQATGRKAAQPVDVFVGATIRARRTSLRMSQTTLAEQLGITFQQVQKYEKGTNRVGASRLQKIAQVLQVPVSYFFEGLDHPDGEAPVPFTLGRDESRLIEAFGRMPQNQRKRLLDLAIAMASDAPTEPAG